MGFADLALLPAHLLAASVQRAGAREQVPVRVRQVGARGLVIQSDRRAPLAVHERARVTIACPLVEGPCEITAQAVRRQGSLTWLTLV
jgi:hypothetical protein